jgi:hypothetical protein
MLNKNFRNSKFSQRSIKNWAPGGAKGVKGRCKSAGVKVVYSEAQGGEHVGGVQVGGPRARCVDLNFNLDKSDGEAGARQRQARRRWRARCWRQGASGGRSAGGKAHVEVAAVGAWRR